ncbi:MAG: hypothetical protein GX601_00670 [Anaerolineales bacterium]|nr:hypothetical protein [Anaerolineales bacterium]
MPYRRGLSSSLVLPGCISAIVMAVISCCLLGGLAVLPAFVTQIPEPLAADPAQPDLAVVVQESFLKRVIAEVLPESLAEAAELDVQADNRFVITSRMDLLLVDLDVQITLLFGVEAGQIKFSLESLETGGYDLAELLNINIDALTEMISQAAQDQIAAGLGAKAYFLSVTTTDDAVVLRARWEP